MTDWRTMHPADFDAGAAPVQEQLSGMPARTVAPGKRGRAGAQLAGQTDIFAELGDQAAADPVPERWSHPLTAADGRIMDRLAKGEAIEGAPGTCARPGCHHALVWHSPTNRRRPCERCDCPGYQAAGQ